MLTTINPNNTTKYWLPCLWDNKEEQAKCDKCKSVPDVIYYRQDKPESTTGDYWCRECASETEQEIIDEVI